MPLDWDKLRIFHAAAEAGSFTHGGETAWCRHPAPARSPGG
ncbi:LysR family transcriptional regulator, partial [Rhizobium leguminosarum]